MRPNPVEYSRTMLKALLLNFSELEELVADERLRVMCYDVHQRFEDLSSWHRSHRTRWELGKVIRTLMMCGDGRVRSKAVRPKEVECRVLALLRQLNEEGLS